MVDPVHLVKPQLERVLRAADLPGY